MSEPQFPFLALVLLSFCAGFGCAIWLAVTFDRGARQIADQKNEQARNGSQLDTLPQDG